MNDNYSTTRPQDHATLGNGVHVVAVDQATEDAFATLDGVISGFSQSNVSGKGRWDNYILIEQGLDTSEISNYEIIDNDLKETQYILEIDNRLGTIDDPSAHGAALQTPSFIDDDNIASYYFSLGTDKTIVKELDPNSDSNNYKAELAGPRGTRVTFSIRASLDLSSNEHLFTTLGGTGTATVGTTPNYAYKYIDTNIRITGATTGASIDIPVRFVKID